MKTVVKLLVVLYLMFAAGMYYKQEELLFLPQQLDEDYTFKYGEEVEVPVGNNLSLNCLHIKDPVNKGLLFFLHGNKGNNKRCIRHAMSIVPEGYDIFMPDYRGFGKSDGELLSEKQMLADITAVFDSIVPKYKDHPIVIVGYSMGTGMAVYLARKYPIEHLVLIAPYTSLSDIKDDRFVPIPDFLMKYDFDVKEHLPMIDCCVEVFHSPNDEVIPYEHSQKLMTCNPDHINLHTIEGKGHRGIIFDDRVRAIIASQVPQAL